MLSTIVMKHLHLYTCSSFICSKKTGNNKVKKDVYFAASVPFAKTWVVSAQNNLGEEDHDSSLLLLQFPWIDGLKKLIFGQ